MTWAKQTGFTIVELLVVIVIIGILAAVTSVAFNGVLTKSHDAVIQSDLSALKKKVEIFAVENNRYPNGLELPQMSFKTSRNSYAISPTTSYNLLYCHHLPNYDHFYVAALSKSGNVFIISDTLGAPERYTGTWRPTQDAMCVSLGAPAPGTNNMRGYAADDTTTGPWRIWAGGS